MTVKELMDTLSTFDPETEVVGMCIDPTDYIYKLPIESIELGDPFDSNGIHGVTGDEIDDWDDVHDKDGEYVGEKVLIINLGNV